MSLDLDQPDQYRYVFGRLIATMSVDRDKKVRLEIKYPIHLNK
jgi:hypothetical protein